MSGNNITIIGNVTRDPELRFTASGQATANFGMAVNRRWQNRQTNEWEEAVSFLNVVLWRELAENAAEDPVLLAAVMHACSVAKADCKKMEAQSLAAIEKGEGKKYFPLNAALGKYYLLQKDYPKAVLYMEAGRDKANKNKIEVNDPVMLVGLAEAYYRNKKFSENLEIYFEIGKQYPAVRQIQEAMQGIYSMEQQSAGDVKIF